MECSFSIWVIAFQDTGKAGTLAKIMGHWIKDHIHAWKFSKILTKASRGKSWSWRGDKPGLENKEVAGPHHIGLAILLLLVFGNWINWPQDPFPLGFRLSKVENSDFKIQWNLQTMNYPVHLISDLSSLTYSNSDPFLRMTSLWLFPLKCCSLPSDLGNIQDREVVAWIHVAIQEASSHIILMQTVLESTVPRATRRPSQ